MYSGKEKYVSVLSLRHLSQETDIICIQNFHLLIEHTHTQEFKTVEKRGVEKVREPLELITALTPAITLTRYSL